MITSEKEYNELLYIIDNPNNLSDALTHFMIPSDEKVYKINLNTREVQAPEFLSVTEDHNSEVIWFKVDRFYDDFDLYGSSCWVQYKNAKGESFVILTIPKIVTDSNRNELYIPWPISSAVTAAAGNVTFSFQFFKLSEDQQRVFYSINTKPATSKILNGLHVDPDKFLEDEKANPQYSELVTMYKNLSEAYNKLNKNYTFYWLEV